MVNKGSFIIFSSFCLEELGRIENLKKKIVKKMSLGHTFYIWNLDRSQVIAINNPVTVPLWYPQNYVYLKEVFHISDLQSFGTVNHVDALVQLKSADN